jgi:hypothetical protein
MRDSSDAALVPAEDPGKSEELATSFCPKPLLRPRAALGDRWCRRPPWTFVQKSIPRLDWSDIAHSTGRERNYANGSVQQRPPWRHSFARTLACVAPTDSPVSLPRG